MNGTIKVNEEKLNKARQLLQNPLVNGCRTVDDFVMYMAKISRILSPASLEDPK